GNRPDNACQAVKQLSCFKFRNGALDHCPRVMFDGTGIVTGEERLDRLPADLPVLRFKQSCRCGHENRQPTGKCFQEVDKFCGRECLGGAVGGQEFQNLVVRELWRINLLNPARLDKSTGQFEVCCGQQTQTVLLACPVQGIKSIPECTTRDDARNIVEHN